MNIHPPPRGQAGQVERRQVSGVRALGNRSKGAKLYRWYPAASVRRCSSAIVHCPTSTSPDIARRG